MVDAEASGPEAANLPPLRGRCQVGAKRTGQRGRCPAGVKNYYRRNAQADMASGLALLLGI